MVIGIFSLSLAVNANMSFSSYPSALSFSKILSRSLVSFLQGHVFLFLNFYSIFFSVGIDETPFYSLPPVKLVSVLFYLIKCFK